MTGHDAPDPPRHRAGVILFIEDRLAVIDRHRPGVGGRFQVLPGGGIEPGETPAQAAVREAREETGLHVEVADRPCLGLRRGGAVHWLFQATVVGGTFGTGDGLEVTRGRPERGSYRPALMTRRELAAGNLVPVPLAELVLRAWSTGVWWDQTMLIDDPDGYAPARVRAGAIVIRDGRMLLIQRTQGTDRWYEIPGGGVEAGETPAAAVARELHEETGLSATVEREVAVVLRGGGRQHYFLVTGAGTIADRDLLDLDEGAEPVWLPLGDLAAIPVWPKRLGWRIAHWQATGWPAAPVRLSDSIVDLDAPCDW